MGRLSRRGFVVGGIGAGIAALGGCAVPQTRADGLQQAQSNPSPSQVASTTAPGSQDTVSNERLYSPARGTAIKLVSIRPAGVAGRLPVCVALHGRSADATAYLDLGVPDMLNAAVAQGMRPFAVVALDGGDSYWVARSPADDPQKMLVEDLPTWLASRGFSTTPFAALGISMGGYGALNYARTPGVSAVAAVSAALFNSWTDAKSRNAFADQQHWEETEPLRHLDAIKGARLGVWCGSADPFVAQARELIDRGHPAASAIGPGGHDDTYWRRVLPDVLRFVGDQVP